MAELLGRVFPRFPEPMNEYVYRFAGKVRTYTSGLLILFDLAGYLAPGAVGADTEVARRWLMVFHTPVLVVVCVLGLLTWKAAWSVATLRRVQFVSATLEASLGLMLLSAMGSVTNYMIFMHACLIVTYRLSFDFRIGLYALAVFLGGHWVLVLLEVTGVWPAGWALAAPPGPVYDNPSQQLWYMNAITVSFAFLYWSANFSIARLRHKDRAIRLLRAVIEANRDVQTGQHSGETFSDRYSLGELLGRGGMGEVYRGRHVGTKRQVAVKTLHPHLSDDDHQLRRFQREAEIVGQLGCDNIVQVLDVDRHDDTHYMVLEYLEGETLETRFQQEGALPPRLVSEVVTQVARGLEIAHNAGVVHRDLKPANVFLCERADGPLAKILDFGVSKIQDSATALTQDLALLGTPGYMSPEQTIGAIGHVDHRTDVFALGAIAYTVLVGRRPFTASSIPSLLLRIRSNEPPAPSSLEPRLPQAVDAVLALAMAKRPEQRYASAAELARDLAAALRDDLAPAVVRRAESIYRGDPIPEAPKPMLVEELINAQTLTAPD